MSGVGLFDGIDAATLSEVQRYTKRGLRAQLKQGNLLTGELYVALDFHPNAPEAELDMNAQHPVIPSVPTDIEALTASVSGILDKLAALPLEELITDLRSTTQSINALASSPGTE